ENNLTQNISALRKTLGESATGQKYIETVTKRGYRFTASVEEILEEEEELVVERHRRARLGIRQKEETDIATPPPAAQAVVLPRHVLPIFQSSLRSKIVAAVLLGVAIVAATSWVKLRHREKDWRSKLRPVTIAGLKSDRSQGLVTGKLSPDGH